MRTILLILSGFLLVLSAPLPVYAGMETMIAAVVNDEAISIDDFEDRLEMVMITSGLPDNAETRQRLASQVINTLVEEQIKLQEAKRLDVTVSEDEIQGGFATIAKQNNSEPEPFKKAVKSSGININTIYRQIRSQLAWQKVVQSEVRSRVNVSESDIVAYREQIQNNIGKNEYLVAEIFLPVENPSQESDIRQLANKLISQVRDKNVPFFRMAQQFSASAGAAQGGNLGWIQGAQLSEELAEALIDQPVGSISAPIRSLNGYHILLLRDKRSISEDAIPDDQEITRVIGLERLERQAQRYLLDLKSSAFVEMRGRS